MNNLLLFFASLVLLFTLMAPPVLAADSISDNASETDPEKAPPAEDGQNGVEEFVDTWHRELSGSITGSADWLDSFFYDERVEVEENRSRLLLRLESFTEDGDGTDLKLKASLRIGIPYAEKKLHLIVVGEPDDEPDTEGISGSNLRQSFDRIDKNDVSVSLQHAIMQQLDRYLSARLGFVFRNWKPRLFLEGRYRTFFNIDPWSVRFTERLRWYTDKGWEARTTFDFQRPVSERLFFQTTVEGDWLKNDNGFSHGLTLSLSQFLSEERAMEYLWSNSFHTSPNYHLEEVAFKVRYRQRIWRDWLFYDIEPQLRFPKADGFRNIPGIMLRLEAIIGRYQRL